MPHNHGKILLVDLAGCERLKKSEVEGEAKKEAIEIIDGQALKEDA